MQRSKGGYPNRKYLSRKRRWSSCRRRRWTSISRAGIASSGRRRKMQRITVKNDSFLSFIYLFG
jgi:hypothetical protein